MTFAFKYMDEDTENTGNGQKSMVKSFLSLEIWQPLGKLTYVMYLIHLMVMEWYDADLETATYYAIWDELLLVIGFWFITALIGLVLWFVVEKPVNNMVSQCMEKVMRKMGVGVRRKKSSKSKSKVAPLLVGHLEMDDSTASGSGGSKTGTSVMSMGDAYQLKDPSSVTSSHRDGPEAERSPEYTIPSKQWSSTGMGLRGVDAIESDLRSTSPALGHIPPIKESDSEKRPSDPVLH